MGIGHVQRERFGQLVAEAQRQVGFHDRREADVAEQFIAKGGNGRALDRGHALGIPAVMLLDGIAPIIEAGAQVQLFGGLVLRAHGIDPLVVPVEVFIALGIAPRQIFGVELQQQLVVGFPGHAAGIDGRLFERQVVLLGVAGKRIEVVDVLEGGFLRRGVAGAQQEHAPLVGRADGAPGADVVRLALVEIQRAVVAVQGRAQREHFVHLVGRCGRSHFQAAVLRVDVAFVAIGGIAIEVPAFAAIIHAHAGNAKGAEAQISASR